MLAFSAGERQVHAGILSGLPSFEAIAYFLDEGGLFG